MPRSNHVSKIYLTCPVLTGDKLWKMLSLFSWGHSLSPIQSNFFNILAITNICIPCGLGKRFYCVLVSRASNSPRPSDNLLIPPLFLYLFTAPIHLQFSISHIFPSNLHLCFLLITFSICPWFSPASLVLLRWSQAKVRK